MWCTETLLHIFWFKSAFSHAYSHGFCMARFIFIFTMHRTTNDTPCNYGIHVSSHTPIFYLFHTYHYRTHILPYFHTSYTSQEHTMHKCKTPSNYMLCTYNVPFCPIFFRLLSFPVIFLIIKLLLLLLITFSFLLSLFLVSFSYMWRRAFWTSSRKWIILVNHSMHIYCALAVFPLTFPLCHLFPVQHYTLLAHFYTHLNLPY